MSLPGVFSERTSKDMVPGLSLVMNVGFRLS